MRSRVFSGLILAALMVGSAIGCTYEPQPLDGKLRCSSAGECPTGYSCSACGTCWSDSRGGLNSGGLWGRGIPSTTLSQYVGNWEFSACANLNTQCDDGYTDSRPVNMDLPSPSVMVLSAGPAGTADLISDWLCLLDMRLDSEGAHLYGNGQSCSLPNPEVPGLVQTWTATRFDVFTSDGLTAIHAAAYKRVDEFADGEKINCTQQVQAPLIKR